MQGKFHQYVFSVFYAILISFGWYAISTPKYSPAFHLHAANHHSYQVESGGFGTKVIRKTKRHRHEKLRAYFSENENENDDTGNDSNSPNLFALTGDSFGNILNDFLPQFHNTLTAVSLANTTPFILRKNALYIHYSVFRL